MNALRLGLATVAALVTSHAGNLGAQETTPADDFRQHSRRAAPRDAFPVFDHPAMSSAAEADRALRPDDWVIGVVQGGEARAYPVAVMGVHELGNDTCGGVPIAVSW